MSIRVMTEIWDNAPLCGSTKLLLLCLADHANDDGICWPSIGRLAARCGLQDRQTQNQLERLERQGYITRDIGQGYNNAGTNLYRILPRESWRHMDGSPVYPPQAQGGVAECTPATECTGGGAEECRGGVHSSAPEPSLNPSIVTPVTKRLFPLTDKQSSTTVDDAAAKPVAAASRKGSNGRRPKEPKQRTFSPHEWHLVKVCRMDPQTISQAAYGRIRHNAKKLAEAGYTTDQIAQLFGDDGLWYKQWPGQDRDGTLHPPRPDQVCDSIKALLTAPKGGNGGNGRPKVGNTGHDISDDEWAREFLKRQAIQSEWGKETDATPNNTAG